MYFRGQIDAGCALFRELGMQLAESWIKQICFHVSELWHDASWMSTYDVRQADEFQCDNSDTPAFRRPGVGVDSLNHGWNPFQENPTWEKVFNITMVRAVDCSKFVPQGYFTLHTKNEHMNTLQDMSSSSLVLSKRGSTSMSVALNAAVLRADFGFSYSSEDDYTHGITNRQSNAYISTSIQSIEDVFTASRVSPPPLVNSLAKAINDYIDESMELNGHEDFVKDLLQKYPFYLSKATTGEIYGQVGGTKLLSSISVRL